MCIRDRNNEATTEILPSTIDWEDVEHDACTCYEYFVNMDEDTVMCSKLMDTEIMIKKYYKKKIVWCYKQNYGPSSDEEGDQPELSDIPISTASQASNYIQDLSEGQRNVNDGILQALNEHKTLLQFCVAFEKQHNISSFF